MFQDCIFIKEWERFWNIFHSEERYCYAKASKRLPLKVYAHLAACRDIKEKRWENY